MFLSITPLAWVWTRSFTILDPGETIKHNLRLVWTQPLRVHARSCSSHCNAARM